jgi:hypothetical protein
MKITPAAAMDIATETTIRYRQQYLEWCAKSTPEEIADFEREMSESLEQLWAQLSASIRKDPK